ncbi:ubiquitin carboxyl-terminal hydrolase 22-A-like [Schistocerca gregaria]|uniref:ubiquitin carboxyl-terminal hydrolase 22-A-like n=1 Tax=Schistocerca gregaria TaxID=7010 RepID=UPI00211EAA87|nr:ubiquitin carboxyl-terminal hydrolase 22-A-like [Schistocerca gregaria]
MCTRYNHLNDHSIEENHFLAVRAERDAIYCIRCRVHVYHSSFTSIVKRAREDAISVNFGLVKPDSLRVRYKGWKPFREEKAMIERHYFPSKVPVSLLGLRGLNNLGNTCFMNVILQSFVHNPFLANYFLADKHNHRHCRLLKSRNLCLGCEVDSFIEHMFSGEQTPFSPHHFLYRTWKCNDHLAGYDQHDAHDFFISTINTLHSHIVQAEWLENETAASENLCDAPSDFFETVTNNHNCQCVIHKYFDGMLRSEVSCFLCKKTSISFESFFDMSLDICSSNDSANSNGYDTLQKCLKQFIKLEPLENFRCEHCITTVECTKQFSLKLLPLVLCLHLKRFKQNMKTNTKIDAYVKFPFNLDMTPYASTSIDSQKKESACYESDDEFDSNVQGPSRDGPIPPLDKEIYSLFAVVNHIGNINNGHYTCYIKHGETWFKCDDHVIVKVTSAEVLQSRAYLLFYLKSTLEYFLPTEDQ